MENNNSNSNKRRKSIRWGRVFGLSFWILLVLLGGALFGVGRQWAGQYLRIQAQELIRRDLGQEVLIGEAGLNLLERKLWFNNVQWQTPGPKGKTVFARIDRIELQFDYRALLRRAIHIRSIRVLHPRIQVSYDVNARANWPVIHIKGGGPALVRLEVDNILIDDLSFFLKHDGIPLILGLTSVNARLVPHPGARHLAGGLRIGRGFLQMYDYNPWQFQGGLQTRLTLDGPWFDAIHLFGERFNVWGTGRVVGYGSPKIDLTLVATVDNKEIETIHNIDFRVHGRSRGIVHYDGDFSIFTMVGWVHSTPFRMGRLLFDDAVSPVYMTENRLVLSGMKGRLTGGEVTGEFKIDPLFGISRYTLILAGRHLDGDAFGRMWGLRYIRHEAEWSGQMGVHWKEDAFEKMVGWTVVQAQAKSPQYPRVTSEDIQGTRYLQNYSYPVNLNFLGEIGGLRYRHAVASGSIGSMTGTIEGRIDFDGGLDIRADVRTDSIAEADMYYHQWLWNLVPEERDRIEFWEMDGQGAYSGRATNRVQDVALDGHFSGKKIRYFDVVWGEVETDVRYWHKIFAFKNAVVTDGRYRMESDEAYLYLGEVDFTLDGDAYADIRFLGYPVERVLEPTPLNFIPIKGTLRGILTVRGNYQQVDLWGDLNLTEGVFGDIPLDFGILRFSYVNFLLQVREGLLAYRGGTLRMEGRWHRLNEAFDQFKVEIHELPLGKLPLFQSYGVQGTLDLFATLNGNYQNPDMEVHGHIIDLIYRQQPAGDIIIRHRDDGPGLQFWFLQDTGVTGYASFLTSVKDLSISGNFRTERLLLPLGSDIRFTGQGVFSGRIQMSGGVEGRVTLEEGLLDFRGFPARLQQPTTWVIQNRRLIIPETPWLFAEDPLTIVGDIHFSNEGFRPEIHLKGILNLDIGSRFIPEIQSAGKANLDLLITGVDSKYRLDGTVRIQNGAIRDRSWPFGLQDMEMTLEIAGERWNISSFRSRVGGGEIEGRGRMVWNPGDPQPGFFTFQFSGQNMTIPIEKSGYIRVSGTGSLIGLSDRITLTGDLIIQGGNLTWEWSGLGGLNLQSREPFIIPRPRRQALPWLSRVNLNLRTRVTDAIPVSFTFGALGLDSQITWNLRTLGTLDRPNFIGVINFQGGQLSMLNRLFNITDGQIQLVSPVEFRPLIRFQAETQVQSYLIRLQINGPLETPSVSLTSDPALPPTTILNLLGGQLYEPGQVREEATGFYTSLGSNFLLTLLTQPIASPAQRALGIDRFSLDFSQLGPEAQPRPRLTLGKSISDKLNVTYSVGLSAIQNQIWLIEYSLNEAFRFLISRDEEGFWGIDLFWRP